MAAATVVTLQRLELFKSLQDELNNSTFLGIHATADNAVKLENAVTIDGVSFDGSANITLPNKVEHIYSATSTSGEGSDAVVTTTYYTDSTSTVAVTGSTTAAYIDMVTGRAVYFDGSTFHVVIAEDDTPRIPLSFKGANNGVAELDASGLVPAEQLPSYVDDVIEGYITVNTDTSVVTFYSDANKTETITGETGKIYYDVEATVDGCYRWTGSRFVAIGTKVSTADRAINDEDGRGIKATYVEKVTDHSLMSATEHTQLATLVADAYIVATEDQIRALFSSGSGEQGGGGGGE